MSVEITLQRSPHDREHPYSMISNALIDNREISNNLKMLLLYCIRKPASWIFDLEYLCDCMGMTKRSLYRIIDEGIKNGYIEKTQQNHNGVFGSVNYFFSEYPKLKKCSPCDKSRHAVNVTPSLYSKTVEFEQPIAEEIRKDLGKLPFGDRDKRILSKYSEEAIEYAKRCISRMPRKPDSEIKVFMSLCESFTNNPKPSAGRKKKTTPEDLARAEFNKKIFMSERMAPLRRIFSLEPDRIVAKIDGNEYAISLYCDLFEEQIKITIGSINEQINHSAQLA